MHISWKFQGISMLTVSGLLSALCDATLHMAVTADKHFFSLEYGLGLSKKLHNITLLVISL